MKTRVVSATEFKAKCLGLLDEVEKSGDSITVTKRGVAVAVVGPLRKKKSFKSPRNILAGKMQIVGDIVNTDDITELWEAIRKD